MTPQVENDWPLRWRNATAFERYKLLIDLVEKGSPPVIETTLDLADRIFDRAFGYYLLWLIGFGAFLLLVIVVLWQTKGPDPVVIPEWAVYSPILVMVLIMVAVILRDVLTLFQPLSVRLKAASVENNIADLLIKSFAVKEDFEPVLKFIKDELDRIQVDVSRATVAAALLGAASLLVKERWPELGVGLLSTSGVFVGVLNVYYHAHMRVLRRANSICLIAESKVRKASDPVQDPE